MSRVHAAALAVAGLLFCSVASAQQRTFVASFGNDANPCTFASPCRSFTAAHAATGSDGEIVALDAAGYGAVTITKSISILTNPGFYAGITASSGNAITIATAGVNVRLSGLKINGIGGVHGISMTDGASLTVENCSVTGFTTNGINVVAAANVRIINTLVANNGLDGVSIDGGARGDVAGLTAFGNGRVGLMAQSTSAVTTIVAATNSVSSQNAFGFGTFTPAAGAVAALSVSGSSADNNNNSGVLVQLSTGTSATMTLGSSKVTGNGTGLGNIGATFNSAGNNLVTGNGSNTSGTITNIGTM